MDACCAACCALGNNTGEGVCPQAVPCCCCCCRPGRPWSQGESAGDTARAAGPFCMGPLTNGEGDCAPAPADSGGTRCGCLTGRCGVWACCCCCCCLACWILRTTLSFLRGLASCHCASSGAASNMAIAGCRGGSPAVAASCCAVAGCPCCLRFCFCCRFFLALSFLRPFLLSCGFCGLLPWPSAALLLPPAPAVRATATALWAAASAAWRCCRS